MKYELQHVVDLVDFFRVEIIGVNSRHGWWLLLSATIPEGVKLLG